MKTLCIYHSKDLDGICSGAIMQLALPGATMYPYDYGQPFDLNIIDEETTVYMADVSMPMPVMEEIAKRSMCFTWIDHHKTTKDQFNSHFYESSHELVTPIPIIEIGKAACILCWEFFFPKKPIPQGVYLLGQYDIWANSNKSFWNGIILPFQWGMRTRPCTLDAFPEIDLLNRVDWIDTQIGKGRLILDYQQQQNAGAVKFAAFEAEIVYVTEKQNLDYLVCICCNAGQHNSLLFDAYDTSEYDMLVVFTFNGENWKFSLFTDKPEIDCGKVAKYFGGGGHKGAAGFRTVENPFAVVFTEVRKPVLMKAKK
jgi:oligoribonuclease NrnB/cAMP/cGMP phosphodiesterase (DHH superfamily)